MRNHAPKIISVRWPYSGGRQRVLALMTSRSIHHRRWHPDGTRGTTAPLRSRKPSQLSRATGDQAQTMLLASWHSQLTKCSQFGVRLELDLLESLCGIPLRKLSVTPAAAHTK